MNKLCTVKIFLVSVSGSKKTYTWSKHIIYFAGGDGVHKRKIVPNYVRVS